MSEIFNTVVVAQGQTVTLTRVDPAPPNLYDFTFAYSGARPTFINNGSIQLSTAYPHDPLAVFVMLIGSPSWSGVTMENNGKILLDARVTEIDGFYAAGGVTPALVNTGDFAVRGETSSYGLREWGGPVTNTGHISVEAGQRAIAVWLNPSTVLKNSGEISAHVTGAGEAVAVRLNTTDFRIENDGLIVATHADPGGTSTGIVFDSFGTKPLEIINRGTITADLAISETALDSYLRQTSIQQVENSGTINGKIALGYYDDTLLNSGRINGAVDLGADNDLYDGRLGSVTGMVAGGDGTDTLLGGQGFDYLQGNAGADSVSGGPGDDWVVGGKDGDVLSGGDGDDVVYSNLGNDTLDGGDGADWVRGGQGDDTLAGGAGNDFMSGDRGGDTISGGAGADTFNTFVGAGLDRVLDFSLAQGDRVHLEAATPYTVTQSGGNTILDLGAGDQVILVGVSVADSVAAWLLVG